MYDGASVAVEDKALGFYLGGWISSESDYHWQGGPRATSNLIIYDMLANTWKNASGPDSTPRAEGVMVYAPLSDSGMLVAFGGVIVPGVPEYVTGVRPDS